MEMENPGNGNLTCLNRLIMENLKEHPGKYIYIYQIYTAGKVKSFF